MRRLLLIALVLVPLLPARAEAVTVRDIIELTRAGLGDEVLLALIEVDRGVFPIDSQTIARLKQAGVSERVIAAMIRSGRASDLQQQQPADWQQQQSADWAEPAPPAPQPMVVIDHHETVREVPVPVAVPVFVDVPRRIHDRDRFDDRLADDRRDGRIDDGRDGRADDHRDRDRRSDHAYWGFGGQRRPDAWK